MRQQWGKDKVAMGWRKGQKWGEQDRNGARRQMGMGQGWKEMGQGKGWKWSEEEDGNGVRVGQKWGADKNINGARMWT